MALNAAEWPRPGVGGGVRTSCARGVVGSSAGPRAPAVEPGPRPARGAAGGSPGAPAGRRARGSGGRKKDGGLCEQSDCCLCFRCER